ncbi:hypothetical protein I350_01625 [Cryptococcus amylolentus CBS 6273]|uniref:Uncharacterized protein n=1 Tax=Cryptococcus amylolentus CBS 6273 TaxID=1296118 RepID=A0A1E3KDC1_9TREE|nr:hypothetical protein I350_01625 [Cryptococcus amylolentus CBS 6273]
MPSLQDTLDTLAQHSAQIAYLSTLNTAPAGPFTSAYLYLPPPHLAHVPEEKGNVLHLIRDASDAERRLFKFVGEGDALATAGEVKGRDGGNKRVEKRDGGIVTPLKELKARAGSEKDETEVMLRTALKLVDDYRSMPRARAHVQNLLDSHHANLDRLAELEMLIEEASQPTAGAPSSPTPAQPEKLGESVAGEPKEKLSAEDALKAEEAALRALESRLAPLRRAARDKQTESQDSVPPQGRNIPQSPPSSSSQAAESSLTSSQMPSQPRTPGRTMPHVTNSLVNATPRHERNDWPERIDRFSPLKLLTTPRAPRPLGGTGLREGIFERARASQAASASEGVPPSAPRGLTASLFGKRQMTPSEPRVNETPAPNPRDHPREVLVEEGMDQADETVRLNRAPSPPSPVQTPPTPTPAVPATPSKSQEDTLAETPRAAVSPPKPSPVVVEASAKPADGIDVESAGVKAGVARIWAHWSDIMRQGVNDGETVSEDPRSSVDHIIRLSKSDPPAPPSPSSSSSISALSSGLQSARPINSDTILSAHLFLSLLRASSGDTREVDMDELKETIQSIAQAKGWGDAGTGSRIVFAAVGKKVITINWKGGGKRVRFLD